MLAFYRSWSGRPYRQRRRSGRTGWVRAPLEQLGALVVIAIGMFAIGDLLHAAADVPQAPSPHFEFCQGARLSFCVIDGDTIRWRGEVVRLQDIDAPEIGDFKCGNELARGNQATSRLRELLNGGAIELVHTGGRDEDRYGRKLRTVRNGQRSLGDILVGEGLARPWNGARRGWCT